MESFTAGEVTVACVGGFFLGLLVAVLVLVCCPCLHHKLVSLWSVILEKCLRDSRRNEKQYQEHNTSSSNDTDRGRTPGFNAYSEIDEQKTETFVGKRHKVKQKEVRPTNAGNRNAYEDVDSPEHLNKRFSNHAYCIVEPGTSKRLQVKRVDKTEERIASDVNHIYFVLEPGTNKVTPVFQNTAEGSNSMTMDSDHTYFVLEATEEPLDLPSAMPYAVNDISGTDHLYFVLEKQ